MNDIQGVELVIVLFPTRANFLEVRHLPREVQRFGT